MNDEREWDARYSADDMHVRGVLAMLSDLRARSATIRAVLALPLGAARVLEIGCGTGQHSVALAQERPYWRFEALDSSPGAVGAARALVAAAHVSVQVSVGDVTALPYPDANFDIVFGDHVIGHISDRQMALSEIVRVLKPGGYALLNSGNKLRIDGWPLYHALTNKKYLARTFFPWTLARELRERGCRRIASFGSVLILTRGLSLLVPARRRQERESGTKTGSVAITTVRPGLMRRAYRFLDAHAPAWLKTDYGVVAQKRPSQ